MSLTLDGVITFCQNQMGESQNTPGGSDSIAYQTLVLEAADEVAQDTNCYSGNVTFDFVANQSIYSTPASVYQIIGAYCTGNDLFIYKLLSSQQEEMDDRYPGWRNLVSGTVTYLIDKGTNQLELYPPPTTSSLVFSYTDLIVSASSQYQVSSASQRAFVSTDAGYVILITGGTNFNTGRYTILSVSGGVATVDQPIGTVASTGGTGEITTGGILLEGYLLPSQTWTINQACPLPAPALDFIKWRACEKRLVQFPSEDNERREPHIQRELKMASWRMEKMRNKYTQSSRRGVRRKYPFSCGF